MVSLTDPDAEILLDAIDGWLHVLKSGVAVPAGQYQNVLQNGINPVKTFYEELRTELRRAIVEIYGRVDSGKTVDLYRPLLLDFWANSGLGRTLPVFTTNYDMAIEALADEAGREIDFIDGFRVRATGLTWDAAVYHQYLTRRRKGVDLVLFKLHGSSNWYRRQGGSIQKIDNFALDPGDLDTIMIFPTQRKSGFLTDEPFNTSYKYFESCLDRLELLIVVGFSFRDMEIRRLITDALISRSKFSVLVIDPGSRGTA